LHFAVVVEISIINNASLIGALKIKILLFNNNNGCENELFLKAK